MAWAKALSGFSVGRCPRTSQSLQGEIEWWGPLRRNSDGQIEERRPIDASSSRLRCSIAEFQRGAMPFCLWCYRQNCAKWFFVSFAEAGWKHCATFPERKILRRIRAGIFSERKMVRRSIWADHLDGQQRKLRLRVKIRLRKFARRATISADTDRLKIGATLTILLCEA